MLKEFQKGKIQPSLTLHNLHNKRVRPTKNKSHQQGISYVEREKEGVRERERGGQACQQAGIFKVRLGFEEIEGSATFVSTTFFSNDVSLNDFN